MAKIVPINKRSDGKCFEYCLECGADRTPADYTVTIGRCQMDLCKKHVKELGLSIVSEISKLNEEVSKDVKDKANKTITNLVGLVINFEKDFTKRRYCPYKINDEEIPKDKGCLEDKDFDCDVCHKEYYDTLKTKMIDKYKI